MSVSSAIEIERKYAVPDGTPLPALHGVADVVTAEVRPVALLEAVYLDTEDRTLLAAGIVLRRRTGGHDAGWHIKLRGPIGRTELHAPIDEQQPDRVPDAFEAALRSRLRGRGVAPLARIRTERTATVVTDSAGGAVEVVDDVVSATDVAAGVQRTWREWEAEQADDCAACRALLERVHEVLTAAGATPSDSPAKIAQALGLVGVERPARPSDTAGAVLAARIAEHVERLHGGLQTLVLDGDDAAGAAVHGLRKTIRRIRSLLALEPVAGPAGAALRERLGEVGRVLGEARDPLVAAETAGRLLDELPEGTPGVDAARALLVEEPVHLLRGRTAALAARLGEQDVLAVLADLEAFAPDGGRAGDAPEALADLVAPELRRARRRGRRSIGHGLDALHGARKAAKRARFVLEELMAAGVVPAKRKRRLAARHAEQAADVLGDHRDLELVLDALPAASERLTAAGGNAYALGLAAERGRAHLAALRRASERAVHRLE
ncbi:CYTH and CHAD domain-containing protein [Amnibacterium soli]|uniref:CYTH and CHAD domain-containing protein n=1 Tax=Amnibacterium soli TaxID=1282736 RepID=A0ABP8Z0E5_9MICO